MRKVDAAGWFMITAIGTLLGRAPRAARRDRRLVVQLGEARIGGVVRVRALRLGCCSPECGRGWLAVSVAELCRSAYLLCDRARRRTRS